MMQVSTALAFGGSVSFGRFMSESLDWGRWSSFRHNRYLEEVERYSRPGSVAQKKAFFEAHYKKKAALKKAGSLEESVDESSENQEGTAAVAAGSTGEVYGNADEEFGGMPSHERPNLVDENCGLEGDHGMEENRSPEETKDEVFTGFTSVTQQSDVVEDIGNLIKVSEITPLKESFVAELCESWRFSREEAQNLFIKVTKSWSVNFSECSKGVPKPFSTKAPSILEKVRQFEATTSSSKASHHPLRPRNTSMKPSGNSVSKLSLVTQENGRFGSYCQDTQRRRQTMGGGPCTKLSEMSRSTWRKLSDSWRRAETAVNRAVANSAAGRYFKIDARKTSFTNELRAGTATFLTMAYIISVNSSVLTDSGGPCSVSDCSPPGGPECKV
ncbi:hypothetical protein J5N97_012780 [Dioscorea zingiberensis]|uniref:Protein WVD2-like 7 n=1 Tax=Dioscorea zingiberensis TaxID=325984 RepID=A0A9D5CPZ3_9LILI|nr:hypothetical protein J5N97_012780 [Dioscorea zingiberensis]